MEKDSIKTIILENHEFIGQVQVMERDISLEDQGNYVFIGPRRAGKTYCMFQAIQGFLACGMAMDRVLYINFEDERLLGLTTDDLHLVIDAHQELFGQKPLCFFDEIQIIEGWDTFVRRLADSKHRVFVTGSNATMLSREVASTLGGRFLIKEILPFSFREFLQARDVIVEGNWEYGPQRHDIRRAFDEYFRFGGFPEIQVFKEKRSWLENLYQKIFYGDLMARYKVRNSLALRLLIKKLAESVQSAISLNRVKNSIQSTGTAIGVSTISEYISYLDESYLVFGVSNYWAKFSERETHKKYYFVDNGILGLFLMNPQTRLLENMVAVELRRRGKEYFFAKRNLEVDFYIPSDELAIQACYSIEDHETEVRETRAILDVGKRLEARRLLIITLDDERIIEQGDARIEVVPIWKFLLGGV